jgi:hypothetical protein
MDAEKFKFPDEKPAKAEEEKLEVSVESDVEIEVVDDTPEADRNRPPMKEAPADVTDEELASYSENAKKRIQHFSKGYHEERRAKESALREREEALRLAQSVIEENKKLQSNLGQGQQALLEQAKKVVAQELEQAKRQYKEAYESGDSDKLVDAQEALTSAKIKAERVNNFKPALQKPKPVVQPDPEPVVPQVDPKVNAWREANPWFGDNKRMTAMALTIHQELVDSGVDTRSDEYFGRINAEMRQVFPDAFPSEKPVKKASVVAPATRNTAPRKIVLTRTQETLAKRLGLTNEQYARAVAEEMRKQNG